MIIMTRSASCHSLAAVQQAISGRDDDENQSVSQSVSQEILYSFKGKCGCHT